MGRGRLLACARMICRMASGAARHVLRWELDLYGGGDSKGRDVDNESVGAHGVSGFQVHAGVIHAHRDHSVLPGREGDTVGRGGERSWHVHAPEQGVVRRQLDLDSWATPGGGDCHWVWPGVPRRHAGPRTVWLLPGNPTCRLVGVVCARVVRYKGFALPRCPGETQRGALPYDEPRDK